MWGQSGGVISVWHLFYSDCLCGSWRHGDVTKESQTHLLMYPLTQRLSNIMVFRHFMMGAKSILKGGGTGNQYFHQATTNDAPVLWEAVCTVWHQKSGCRSSNIIREDGGMDFNLKSVSLCHHLANKKMQQILCQHNSCYNAYKRNVKLSFIVLQHWIKVDLM